jgi:hypothetical protein
MSDTKHPAEVLADRMDQATAHGSLYYLDVPARIEIASMLRRIPALEADRDALRAEVERLTAGDVRYMNEVEALRRDAERYRFVRTADKVPISAEAARDPLAYDAAIDAAMMKACTHADQCNIDGECANGCRDRIAARSKA